MALWNRLSVAIRATVKCCLASLCPFAEDLFVASIALLGKCYARRGIIRQVNIPSPFPEAVISVLYTVLIVCNIELEIRRDRIKWPRFLKMSSQCFSSVKVPLS